MKKICLIFAFCIFVMCGCAKADISKWPEAEGYTEADLNVLLQEIAKICPEEIVVIGVGRNEVLVLVNKHLIKEMGLDTQAKQDAFLLQIEYEINIALQEQAEFGLPECFIGRRVPISLEFDYPPQLA